MESLLIEDVIIIFGLSVLVIYLFHRIKVPAIIGFLLTGILVGPNGFELIKNPHEVEIMAEFGVILLLFTIGIEFSLKNLLRIKRIVLLGGSIQVALTVAVTWFIVYQLEQSFQTALFAGFLVSLSSTAVVLKVLQEKGEFGALHGQTSLGILIFQDLIVVGMILITPVLGHGATGLGSVLLITLLKGLALLLFVFLGTRYVIPRLLFFITKTQSRELFMITIIVLGFTVAWLTSSVGLSIALGAFIGGLMISESDYAEQAFGNIIPFRDAFASFFFVSIGMLIDVGYIWDHLLTVVVVTLCILLLKTILTGIAAFLLGFPFRSVLITGLSLSQIGEFSFILSEFGIKEGVFPTEWYQLFLSVTVVSMAITPFIIEVAPRFSGFVLRMKLPERLRCGLSNLPEPELNESMNGHLIIIGYGVNGRNVARAAKFAKIPHIIIEMNPETVREHLVKGEIIHFGDATQEVVLNHANLPEAKVLVVTVPNPSDSRRITVLARQLNPNLHIIVRTRLLNDMRTLHDLGADQVIPEEFETSIEIFTRVLSKFQIPHDAIEDFVEKVRFDNYEMFRSLSLEKEKQ